MPITVVSGQPVSAVTSGQPSAAVLSGQVVMAVTMLQPVISNAYIVGFDAFDKTEIFIVILDDHGLPILDVNGDYLLGG